MTLWMSLGIVFFLFLFSFPCDAQIGNPMLSIELGRSGSTEVDDPKSPNNGEVEETKMGISFFMPAMLLDDLSFEFGAGFSNTVYDWTDPKYFHFSRGKKPWESLSYADVGCRFTQFWDKAWSSFLGVNLISAWESEMNDSFSYGLTMGAMYHSIGGMSFVFGAGYFLQPGDNDLIYPIIGVGWNRGGGDTKGIGFSGSVGYPETEIRYTFNEWWTMRMNFESNLVMYRLEDDSWVSTSGLVEISGYSAGLFADFYPIEPLKLSIGLSYDFDREWNLMNEDGDDIGNVDVDNSISGSFEISWTF